MEEKGIKLINSIVKLWSNKYMHLTTFLREKEGRFEYMCEFSRPLAGKPNPMATVKVYFSCKFG
jgi:hypothetical protein